MIKLGLISLEDSRLPFSPFCSDQVKRQRVVGYELETMIVGLKVKADKAREC